MRIFRCQTCGEVLYFEAEHCPGCGRRLGFLPDVGLLSVVECVSLSGLLSALEILGVEPDREFMPDSQHAEAWHPLVRPDRQYRFCANAGLHVCNWMVPAASADVLCMACRHNRTVSDVGRGHNLERWRRLEGAKRRLFYSLLRLRIPLTTRAEDPEGLAFDFLADAVDPKGPKIMTGHASGLITIALREADDAEREQVRHAMGEPYRTLLGHFRHEVGHYCWDRLVRDAGRQETCRAMFGDERQHYGSALRAYYAGGPPRDWQEGFITPYASSHPWEDFAETWAHYLHIVDTLETASAFGVGISPRHDRSGRFRVEVDFDPYREREFGRIMDAWLPLVLAVNNLNRSMGQPDLYPFFPSPRVTEKLRFIHKLLHGRGPH